MKNIFKDKRGVSLSAFTEVALISVLLISMLTIIGVGMNSIYDDSADLTFGMSGISNTTLENMKDYQSTIQSGTGTGTAESTDSGISLTSTWGMILGGFNVVTNFITGSWIEKAIGTFRIGEAGTKLALILRIIFFFALGFIIIRLIMKVKP